MSMLNTDVRTDQVSPLSNDHHQPSEQPIDRHQLEITDELKTVFINAGIDSTCAKKRASIVHRFINGTITVATVAAPPELPMDNLLDLVTLSQLEEMKIGKESSTSELASDTSIPECCSHCGK